jgi:signal transduction histidine kinase/CheY-like chemotaxis protein
LRLRPATILRALAVGIPVLIALALVGGILAGRDRRVVQGQETLETLNVLLAAQLDRSFDSIDLVLRQMASQVIQYEGVADAREAGVDDDFRALGAGLPFVYALTWVDGEGQIMQAETHQTRYGFVGADADTRRNTDLPPGRMHILPPQRAALDGEVTITALRTVPGNGSRPHGYVALRIAPASLSQVFAPANVGTGFAGRLFQDRILLATFPHIDALIGQSFPPDPRTPVPTEAGAQHYSSVVTSQIDQRPRLLDVRRIGDLSLISVVSLPVAVVLEPESRQNLLLVPLAALCAIVIGIGFWLLAGAISANERAQALIVEGDRRKLVAEEANREKSRFLAAASHDLRQPLHALGLFASALARRVDRPEQVNLVNSIRESIGAMTEMFGALLDLTRIDAGGIEPKPQAFALEPLLERIVRDITAQAAVKGLKVRHVPTSLHVDTDPVLLETILRNLATNAVRYTAAGRILLGCRRHGPDQVRIIAADTGLGIAEADQQRIFREFERVQGTGAGASHGLGLGLAIVRRLAQTLGLQTGLRSVPGRGSAFWVTVPMATAPVLAASAAGSGPDFRGSLAVLDDEAAIRDGLCQELRDRGISCWAPEEPETPDPARLAAVDALVVDLNLGAGHDGLAILAEAERRAGRRLTAVMVTGSTDPQTLERLQRSGRPWLHKPVSADAIINAVGTALNQR